MRITCWQAGSDRVREGSLLDGLRAAVAGAVAAGADLLVAPEMSLTGYEVGAGLRSPGTPVDGPDVQAVRDLATRHGITVVAGWPEFPGPGGRRYNSAVLVDPAGHATVYRKTHLFGAREKATFTPGAEAVVQADVAGVRVGLLVCYDVEFPEAVRLHASAGTDLLVVPSALPAADRVVVTTIVPARALENGFFVAYVNWAGREAALEYAGLTRVAGPDATIVAEAGGIGECLVTADIDLGAGKRARAATPYLDDRRPELYAQAPAVPGDLPRQRPTDVDQR
ncbi:nitrilase-related carbon-nitrogen hydrolase [Paractinoplanes lichenicola]|uniref:Carbon-nitrogen hydrolase n=1 Tax=Paractinoplanes lichenicola TaxID=2802976 RepID=A0ABS1W093_9ACTN|nr:nitrilase-related carbon-nitrogen hydrolase [Actinoplanes lichenicola]MBL7260160.1 carbon-nitrogen hydrolase [Actinoplanes lichenicola]